MKDGSIDIPAIKFVIVSGDVFTESGDFNEETLDDLRIFTFEQVDGLTVKQFLNLFNGGNNKNGIGISAFLDISSKGMPNVWYTLMGIRIASDRLNENLDLEISEFFENILVGNLANNKSLSSDNDDITPDDIVSTFCARYRGRDKEFINQRVRKLRNMANNNKQD